MKLIMGGINGEYLKWLFWDHKSKVESVSAAVAYASDSRLLFDWCWDHKIPLKFWGRLDDKVAVNTKILSDFLKRQSPTYVCKLVQYHHAKVIWWRGLGLYIGSANLTDHAWYKNVETGCFFEESEIDDNTAADIEMLFNTLESQATPLTDELYDGMVSRSKEIRLREPPAEKFWSSPSFKTWSGLGHIAPKNASDRKRQEFLEEWHSTLQDLRKIGELVSEDENRPVWISEATPAGAQADQFLHGHYFQRTFDGRKANYDFHFEKNKNAPSEALNEAVAWWKNLPEAPMNEDKMLNERSPFLRELLSQDKIQSMEYKDFKAVCENVFAITDYSRRVPNKLVSLPDDGTQYSIPQKVDALSKTIWADRSGNGSRIDQILSFVLYGGSSAQLPERLWDAVSDSAWKIDGLGISAFGEIVGWAMPDVFPPRNGRTSKALRSLGYDVRVHVE
nr:phospholipase [Cytophagales bacterium]